MMFHIQRQRIRKEIKTRIKQGVPKGEMRVFSFSLSGDDLKNLQWHNDHEFRFEQRMYDVVHRSIQNDSIYFQCIDDNQETVLFAQLDELTRVKQNTGPYRQQNTQWQFALSLFYLNASGVFLPENYIDLKRLTSPYIFPDSAGELETDTPPPRFIS